MSEQKSGEKVVKTYNKYVSNIQSVQYIFKNGKVAAFVAGQYLTCIPSEIAELDEEVALGHPHISVDSKEKTVDSNVVDPLAAIKKRAVEEYIARQAAAVNPENDMGNTKQEAQAGMQTTKSVASISMPPKVSA